jgi:hypothetical protein
VDALPQASVDVTVTVFTPTGKAVPEAGLKTVFTVPPQLSVTVTAGKLITEAQVFASRLTEILAGQVSAGGVWSLTFIICIQVAVFPQTSVAR